MPQVAEPLPEPAIAHPPARPTGDGALATFDVFDTVLTRRIGAPHAAFLLLGRRLRAMQLLSISGEAFSSLRRQASGRAYRNHGAGWTLSQIYDELQFSLNWSDAVRDAAQAEEIALEHELTVAIPGVREKLASIRERDGRITFISDMYLDSATIRSLLEHAGVLAPQDRVYVSSETGCSKSDGAAFHCVARAERVAVERICHYGNDLRIDVAGARKAGATAVPWLEANMNRYEEALEKHERATEGLASAMAGASRLARLAVPAPSPHHAVLRDVAAGVGAPALVSFVLWLLLRARSMKLTRLYFLSRDGLILMQIAERLLPKLDFQCELRYLRGGRRAWFEATAFDATPRDLFWALDHGSTGETPAAFLRRLGVEPDEVEAELEALDMPRHTWDVPRPPAEFVRLWAAARAPAIRTRILERAAARRERVLAYFQQEGLLDDQAFAVVDIGWSGRAIGAMSRILGSVGADLEHAFFFARFVDKAEHNLTLTTRIDPWFADHTRMRGYPRRVNELHLELFCGADEGVTLDYRIADDAVHAVTDGADNPRLVAWGLPVIHETILAFAEALWLERGVLNPTASMRAAIADVLHLFSREPAPAEATAWGAYPFEHGRLGGAQASIAAPYTLSRVLDAVRTGRLRRAFRAEWSEAALLMTPRPVRFVLRTGLAARTAVAGRLQSWRARARGRAAAAQPAEQTR